MVKVNDNPVEGPAILNKPVTFVMKNGWDVSWFKFGRWDTVYSPSFSDEIRTGNFDYAIPDVDPYKFVWDITGLVHKGSNKVSILNHKYFIKGSYLVLRNLKVETGTPINPAVFKMNYPDMDNGRLRTFTVKEKNTPVNMDLSLGSKGNMKLKIAGHTFMIDSRTSDPDGKWALSGDGIWKPAVKGKTPAAKWSGKGYTVKRAAAVFGDHITVYDTITNTSNARIGVIYENRLHLPVKPEEVTLGGKPGYAAEQSSHEPANPTAVARLKDMSIGVVAEDDILRVHNKSFKKPGVIGVADNQLGIAPGKSHTLEWSIYPAIKGDYWDVINNIRRNWGSNMTINGNTFVIVLPNSAHKPNTTEGVEFYRDWLKKCGVKIIVTANPTYIGDELDTYGGKDKRPLAAGPDIMKAKRWMEFAKQWIARMKEADPSVKWYPYIDANVCCSDDGPQKYADSLLYDENGKPCYYPYSYQQDEYVCSMDNSFGKEHLKVVEEYLDTAKPDGLYMDEFSYSGYFEYAYNTTWDGCSVVIDPKTHAVTRERSSVTLLQSSWREAVAKLCHDRGLPMLANMGMPTRRMLKLQIPSFRETPTSCATINSMHLSAPVGLGNNTYEPTEKAKIEMTRKNLLHGGLQLMYTGMTDPAEFSHFRVMYPATPQEIRAGMVLCKERIITIRSGIYGWKDGSAADVCVFDVDGNLVKNPPVKAVRSGKGLAYEVKLPDSYLAVLVKKAK